MVNLGEIACSCGGMAHIDKRFHGQIVMYVIECPKCHKRIKAMDKNNAIRNFNK